MSGTFAAKKEYPVFSVGPDEFNDYDFVNIPDDYGWFVYYYAIDGYEGGGISFAAMKDGKYGFTAFSHCSCYGPTDGWKESMVLTRNEVLEMKEKDPYLKGRTRSPADSDYKEWMAIFPKVEELLAQKRCDNNEPCHCSCSA